MRLIQCQIPRFFSLFIHVFFYQQGVAAAHNAEAQAGAALGDVDGGLAPRDDGTGGWVAGHGGGSGRAALALKQRRLRCDVEEEEDERQPEEEAECRGKYSPLPASASAGFWLVAL